MPAFTFQIARRRPFAVLTNDSDTTHNGKASELLDKQPCLTNVDVRRSKTQVARGPGGSSEPQEFKPDQDLLLEFSKFKFPQKSSTIYPVREIAAQVKNVLRYIRWMVECRDKAVKDRQPQLFRSWQIQHSMASSLPFFVIMRKDIVGPSVLRAYNPGYIYIDPAAGSECQLLPHSRLSEIANTRSIDFHRSRHLVTEQQFHLSKAVHVFIETKEDHFQYLGNFFLVQTGRFLDKKEWMKVPQSTKNFLIDRYCRTPPIFEYDSISPRPYTEYQVRKWYQSGQACPLFVLHLAQQQPIASMEEILPTEGPETEQENESTDSSSSTIHPRSSSEDQDADREIFVEPIVFAPNPSFFDSDVEDEDESDDEIPSSDDQPSSAEAAEDDSTPRLNTTVLTNGAIELEHHLRKLMEGLATLKRDNPQEFADIQALGAQLSNN